MSETELQAEIKRLNKVVQALMNRAERNDNVQGSDFNLFHTAVLLEEQVRRRTEELEAAIEENTRITREVEALNRKLQEQAIRDALTGLFNRRFLDDVLNRELALARRKGYAVSLVMGDIDHFKRVNDTYGHQAGDEVLKTFALILQKKSRSSDICCRYGGEEFLLLMPEVSQERACQRAEEFCQVIRQSPFLLSDGVTLNITASFGVASFPKHGQDGDRLTASADVALYEAKRLGRDRVVCR